MKKTLIILSVLIILTIITIVARKGNIVLSNSKKIIQTEKQILDSLPNFRFTTLKNRIYSKNDLDPNKSTIIVRFDPDCESCENSAILFEKFKKLHESSNVLFVSSNELSKISNFGKNFKLDKIQNLELLQSNESEFYSLFNELNTPSYFIYNKGGKKIKLLNEEVPANILFRYIKASQIE